MHGFSGTHTHRTWYRLRLIVMGRQRITLLEHFMQQFKQLSETSIDPPISYLDVK